VAVAELFKIAVADLIGPRKKAILVDARSVVALILRNRGLTLAEIGHLLHRDYSSISYLCARIERDHDLKALAEGLVA
jgi:chromosomal replication initiation ATPase DnaA